MRSLSVLLLVAVGTPCVALQLELSVAQPRQLVWENNEFNVVVVNDERGSVALAPGMGALEVSIQMDGRWVPCRSKVAITPGAAQASWVVLQENERFELGWPAVKCLCTGGGPGCEEWNVRPGDHAIRATWTHELPPHVDAPQGAGRVFQGALRSAPVTVAVHRPLGVDAEALAAMLKGGNVLRFPRSRYAAHAVSTAGRGLVEADPAAVLDLIAGGKYLVATSLPDDQSDTASFRTLEGDDLLAWRARWFGTALEHHPDLWFADELRLRLAVDKIAQGLHKSGATMLQTITKDASPTVRSTSARYLALMIERGMVSTPTTAGQPPAAERQ